MIYVIAASLFVIAALIYMLNMTKDEIKRLQDQIEQTAASHIIEKAKVKKDSTFRSSAVNWGKTIGHFVPFMTKFPVPAEDVVFVIPHKLQAVCGLPAAGPNPPANDL